MENILGRSSRIVSVDVIRRINRIVIQNVSLGLLYTARSRRQATSRCLAAATASPPPSCRRRRAFALPPPLQLPRCCHRAAAVTLCAAAALPSPQRRCQAAAVALCAAATAAVCWLVVVLLSAIRFSHVIACCHATSDAMLLATFPNNCLKLVFRINCCLGKLMFIFVLLVNY